MQINVQPCRVSKKRYRGGSEEGKGYFFSIFGGFFEREKRELGWGRR
jgi:hypothetical protein